MKKIIGLVGKMASGKGTIAEYLEKEYNANTYRFSTTLRDILNRLHSDITRKNMQDLSFILRERFGEDLFARVIANDVEKDDNNIIIVDGIRRMADIKYLQKLDNFILVKVVADSKTRYSRLIQRAENSDDQKKTYEQFLEDHKKETETTIPEVMDKATKKIDNNNNYKELYEQINKIIK